MTSDLSPSGRGDSNFVDHAVAQLADAFGFHFNHIAWHKIPRRNRALRSTIPPWITAPYFVEPLMQKVARRGGGEFNRKFLEYWVARFKPGDDGLTNPDSCPWP
jgi:hypothetical protein